MTIYYFNLDEFEFICYSSVQCGNFKHVTVIGYINSLILYSLRFLEL